MGADFAVMPSVGYGSSIYHIEFMFFLTRFASSKEGDPIKTD